jgi:hypothetical protein
MNLDPTVGDDWRAKIAMHKRDKPPMQKHLEYSRLFLEISFLNYHWDISQEGNYSSSHSIATRPLRLLPPDH